MKSIFRILVYVSCNYINRKGETGIMIRITLDGEISQFSSKLNVNPDNWDTKRGKVMGKTKEAKNLNDTQESSSSFLPIPFQYGFGRNKFLQYCLDNTYFKFY